MLLGTLVACELLVRVVVSSSSSSNSSSSSSSSSRRRRSRSSNSSTNRGRHVVCYIRNVFVAVRSSATRSEHW